MKWFNRIALSANIVLAISVTAFAQMAPKAFTVTGNVKNGAKGEKITLLQSLSNGGAKKLDSTQIAADGSFSIKGIEKDGGSFYQLNIADRDRATLLVEGGENLKSMWKLRAGY